MKKIALITCSLLMAITLLGQNANDLKLNLEKNKVYRLKSFSEQTIVQTMNGVPQTTNVKSSSTVSLKMMDATPGFMVAEIKFDTILTNTNAMGKSSTMNSSLEGNIASQDMNDVLTCIMNRLSKNPLYVKMDYSGKVLEIVNAKMLSAVLFKDTNLISGPMAAMVKLQVQNAVNDKALITMVETFTSNLPAAGSAQSDKWNNTVALNAGGMALEVVTTYKLNAQKGTNAEIAADSKIQASANAMPIDYGTAKVGYNDLKGAGKSSMVIDSRTGLILESKSKTKISGNLNISASGMNMTMPMDMDIESTIVAL
jgi:hypothetical protein